MQLARQDDAAEVTLLQHAAYAPNRAILGVEPLPLLVNYDEIINAMEVWLAHGGGKLKGVLVLQPQDRQLLIWSVATSVASQSMGLGNRLLTQADSRACELGLAKLVLYTGSLLTDRIALVSAQRLHDRARRATRRPQYHPYEQIRHRTGTPERLTLCLPSPISTLRTVRVRSSVGRARDF